MTVVFTVKRFLIAICAALGVASSVFVGHELGASRPEGAWASREQSERQRSGRDRKERLLMNVEPKPPPREEVGAVFAGARKAN